MFVYCYNNPVCFSDATGDYPDDYFAQIGQQIGAWLGGVLYDVGVSLHTYITNDSTDEVKDNLEADGFSFYKGVPVLSADWMGTSALSFGIIVMGSGNLGRSDFADTLNHEYGHTRHFAMVGPVDYLFTTAIPSLTFAGLTNKELFSYEYCYDLPWERTADYLGGVEREYLPDTNTYASIFWIYTLLNAKATLY